MRSSGSIAALIAVAFFGGVTGTGFAQSPGASPAASRGTPAEATARIVAAAQALVNALDDAQRKQAILDYRVSDLVLGNDYGAKFTRK